MRWKPLKKEPFIQGDRQMLLITDLLLCDIGLYAEALGRACFASKSKKQSLI